jgi:DNA polymerase III gamma/tau subunit
MIARGRISCATPSIFDQAIAHGGAVTAEPAPMLGLSDRAVIDLFEHLMKGDIAAALANTAPSATARLAVV